jgi:lysylphosphatidylglycerol synthetase-like protein (DUF2156 family)
MAELAGTHARLDPELREKLLLPLLTQHARQGVSYAALQADVAFYVGREVHGFVPVVASEALWLGLGEPLCRPEHRAVLAREFVTHAREAGIPVAFFPIPGAFLHELTALGMKGVAAAVEPVTFLDGFSLESPQGRKLRQSVKRASHHELRCELKFGDQLADDECRDLEALARRWLQEREGSGPRLLLAPTPFAGRAAKRYAIAYGDAGPAVFASLVPIPGRNGWMVEGLFRTAEAPRGSSECLLARTFAEFRDEGFGMVALGPSLLAVRRRQSFDGELETDCPVTNLVFRWLYAHAPELLNYRSAHRFKLKFSPDRTEPCYLVFEGERPDPELLHRFLGVMFPGVDFKGLVHELWERLSSESVARTLLPEDEEE